MRKELGDVTQLVCLQAMDGGILLHEHLVKELRVHLVDETEPLREQAVIPQVRALLRATLREHRADFHLLSGLQMNLHQLVTSLFKVQGRHDGEINGTTQIDQVRLGLILNLLSHRLLCNSLRPIFAFAFVFAVAVIIILFLRRGLAQDLFLDLRVLPLALLVLRVDFENIQSWLSLKFVVHRNLMHDLVFLLHQIELRRHAFLSFESRLSDREEVLDHELHALVDFPFVQDPAEALEDPVQALRSELVQGVPALLHEFYGHLDAIVRRCGKQDGKEFQRDELMYHLLVDEMR